VYLRDVPEGSTITLGGAGVAGATNRRFLAMMLAFGIAFEMLLLIMLNLAGILTHERFVSGAGCSAGSPA
jgi:hypothetical protein